VIWIVLDTGGEGILTAFYDYLESFCYGEVEFELAAVTGDVKLLDVVDMGANIPSFYIFFLAIITPKSRIASKTLSPVLALTYSQVYPYLSASFLTRWISNEVPLG
jgi:hypothetical protein